MTAYCLEVSLLKVLQRWLTTGLQKILAKAIALYRLQNLQVHKNHHLYTKQAFVSCLIAGRHPIYSARLSPFRLHLKHNIFLFFFYSLFAKCHPIISPYNFYKGCIFDSSNVNKTEVLCTSLQTYAAACARAGVCVYWRNHTKTEKWCGKKACDI